MQSLSFVSLLLSMMALYSAYRAIAEADSFIMPLWSMGCRSLQVALEAGLIMLAMKLQAPPNAMLFPQGLSISTGVYVCGTHMCIALLGFSAALHVFLRFQKPPRPSFVLFAPRSNHDDTAV
ncbi:hypothetical protein DYB36_001962 [Aphanomyces astaci]|uniref:Protein RFT1 homolog n=1 Tax=Aphanomyces astaci TaxID=112090 RepID=A0A397AS98_APHAT|nr:hypothetical protein DYB36_001962 [Aphanomyces astaci]